VIRHLVQTAQIAEHDFQGHVLANFHHIEVHQRADRILLVRHGRAQLLALFDGERFEDVLNNFTGEVRREVRNLVRVELLGRSDELVLVHARDEALAHGIGYFQEDLAVAIGLDEIPDDQPLLERQRFEDVSDVGRMQSVQLALERLEIFPMNERLDALARRALVVLELLRELVLAQKLGHLFQELLPEAYCVDPLFHRSLTRGGCRANG
jgi:hypothetical protein